MTKEQGTTGTHRKLQASPVSLWKQLSKPHHTHIRLGPRNVSLCFCANIAPCWGVRTPHTCLKRRCVGVLTNRLLMVMSAGRAYVCVSWATWPAWPARSRRYGAMQDRHPHLCPVTILRTLTPRQAGRSRSRRRACRATAHDYGACGGVLQNLADPFAPSPDSAIPGDTC